MNQKFDYQPCPPLKHPGIDFTRGTEECDLAIIRSHPPLPLFEKRNHHPGLSIQSHCPRLPSNVTKTCQPQQSLWIQTLEVLGTDLAPFHRGAFWPPWSAEHMMAVFRRSSTYSFHRRTTSPVKVKSSPALQCWWGTVKQAHISMLPIVKNLTSYLCF